MPDVISSNSDTKAIGKSPSDVPWYEPMTTAAQRVADYSERQREKNPPTIIELGAAAGLPILNQTATTTRLRIKSIIQSGTSANRIRINFGGRAFFFNNPANDTKIIDFPYEVDRGIDISATLITGDVPWSIYIVAYTE